MSNFALILLIGVLVKNLFEMVFQSITRFTWKIIGRQLKANLAGFRTATNEQALRTFRFMSFLTGFIEVCELGFYLYLALVVHKLLFSMMAGVGTINALVFLVALFYPAYSFDLKGFGETKITKLATNVGFFKNVTCLSVFMVYLCCIR